MKIIAALGNPGNKYINTRHNIGFIYADELAKRHECDFKFESKFNAEIAKCTIGNIPVWIVKPQTFMNLSGSTVKELANFYKLTNKDFFIVYDDISMNLGAMRFRSGGSDGGHNGIKSIILSLNTDKFDRLKLGIGPQPERMSSENFVLQKFNQEETLELSNIIPEGIQATECYLTEGLQQAQNKYNRK